MLKLVPGIKDIYFKKLGFKKVVNIYERAVGECSEELYDQQLQEYVDQHPEQYQGMKVEFDSWVYYDHQNPSGWEDNPILLLNDLGVFLYDEEELDIIYDLIFLKMIRKENKDDI